jgi:hypothetical protein
MPFTKDHLLLTDERRAQLEAALANTGVPDPLALAITEAEAEVERLTLGYVVAEPVRFGWIRSVALYRAWAITGAVPEDVRRDYEAAWRELTAISAAERKNLPRAEAPALVAPARGAWGARANIFA